MGKEEFSQMDGSTAVPPEFSTEIDFDVLMINLKTLLRYCIIIADFLVRTEGWMDDGVSLRTQTTTQFGDSLS